MSKVLYERLKENLEALKMHHTLDILDNYLERAIKDELNIVDVLDHIFTEEARNKRQRAYEKQIQMSGFPIKKTLEEFDFSFQPSIDKRQIDELSTVQGANYDNPEQAEMDIFKYIETYYNTKRIHSALGYLSPSQFESQNP